MQPSDFQFFVLPLAILDILLAALVFYLGRNEERHKKKLAKLVGSYVRQRLKQEKMFAEELEHLEDLFLEESIDKATYVRLKELLERNIEQQRKQARQNMEIPVKH